MGKDKEREEQIMEITKYFEETSEMIQKHIQQMKSKKEIPTYLNMLVDYIKATKNMVKIYMEGME